MTNLSTIIDQIGDLECEIARLEREAKAIKAALADLEAGNYEGERFRLNISVAHADKPDDVLKEDIAGAVAAFRETLSHQYLTAHTVRTTTRRHRVTVRKDVLAA